MGHTLAGKVLLHRLEAAAAECDMIDNPRVGALLLVGLGDVIEVQYGMARAIQPGTGKIERRARTIHEIPEHPRRTARSHLICGSIRYRGRARRRSFSQGASLRVYPLRKYYGDLR